MIQDIGKDRFNNAYKAQKVTARDCMIVMWKDQLLIKKQGDQIQYPTWAELSPLIKEEQIIYLFSIDETGYYLVMAAEQLPIAAGTFVNLSDVRGKAPKENVFVAATAWHLYVWYRDHQFCGRCGTRTTQDEKERMLRCNKCGNMIFPRIAPAVIVGIRDGRRLLLTRYANRSYKKYALVAGFTEIGETPEETVRREVMEEVGLRVKNIQYYKSQPWGFDGNLLLGFWCDVDGDIEVVMDQAELSVAEWVEAEYVPNYEEGLSLTHEMMQVFRRQYMR